MFVPSHLPSPLLSNTSVSNKYPLIEQPSPHRRFPWPYSTITPLGARRLFNSPQLPFPHTHDPWHIRTSPTSKNRWSRLWPTICRQRRSCRVRLAHQHGCQVCHLRKLCGNGWWCERGRAQKCKLRTSFCIGLLLRLITVLERRCLRSCKLLTSHSCATPFMTLRTLTRNQSPVRSSLTRWGG